MTSMLSENIALPVTGHHRHKQPRRNPDASPFNPVRINIRRLFLTLVAVNILWLETDYPDGSRSAKLLMG